MAWTTPRTWVTGELVTAALLNTHIRDNQEATWPLDSVAYEDWTPTTNGLTVGDGTTVARYIQIGEMVHAWYRFTFGSTSAITASVAVSAPVTHDASYDANDDILGPATFRDTGSARYFGSVRLPSVGNFVIFCETSSGSYVSSATLSSTVPFTWTTGDKISFNATYQAA